MTQAWALSLARAALLALLFIYPACLFAARVQTLKGPHKKIIILLFLLPLAVPPLLPAYAWSAFNLNFQTQPMWNEIVYCIITGAKALPVACLIMLLLPAPVSPHSLHCNQLLPNRGGLTFYDKYRKQLLAFFVLFLLIFHEYEMASLMRIKHWTVVIFNAHAGGLTQSTGDSFLLAALPLATSVTAVITGIKLLPSQLNKKPQAQKVKSGLPLYILIILFLTVLLIYPLIRVLIGAGNGFSSVFQGRWMHNELLNSLLFSSVATVSCWFLSTFIAENLKSAWKISLFLIPGLTGSLILGLGMLAIIILPGAVLLKNTAVPLSIALILHGLPLAVLMQIVRRNMTAESTLHSAALLPGKSRKDLLWKLQRLPAILCSLPVFCLIWFDLTLFSILAPASMPGIFPRLYNLMHYSENEKLSATVFIVFFIPLIVAGIMIAASKLLPYRSSRHCA